MKIVLISDTHGQHHQLELPAADVLIHAGDFTRTGKPFQAQVGRTIHGEHTGCEDLRRRIEKARPKISVFGHIHESHGRMRLGDTEFFNASVLGQSYRMVNPPFVVEL